MKSRPDRGACAALVTGAFARVTAAFLWSSPASEKKNENHIHVQHKPREKNGVLLATLSLHEAPDKSLGNLSSFFIG
jgi:hypothetical protein